MARLCKLKACRLANTPESGPAAGTSILPSWVECGVSALEVSTPGSVINCVERREGGNFLRNSTYQGHLRSLKGAAAWAQA
ncbi:hypothetical protein ABBQ32_011050 [Trebouxia sp. C0010 RCD-2024]